MKRVRYFDGMLLSTADFQAEQQYLREKRKMHNRCLHGFGVVCGLDVSMYKGGIRISGNVTIWETVELARLMTLKTAVTDTEFGGGKTGIRVDMPAMYRLFGRQAPDPEFEKVMRRIAEENGGKYKFVERNG